MNKPGLRKFRSQEIDCFPVGYVHFPVCMLVHTGQSPAALSMRPEEEIRAAVRAYAKGAMWLPVWPSRHEDYAFFDQAKNRSQSKTDVDDLLEVMRGNEKPAKK